jgi:EmrB/QacA subfamily drug resistance transporter
VALVVLCTGQLMIVLDATAVNVALPVIERDLHFSQASLAWVVNAYLLTFGGLLMLAGRLGDLLGRLRLLLVGLGAFSVASMLCGLSPNGEVLVGARFLQGATAAMVASMVLGIISPMFPEARDKAIALSVFAFVSTGGGSLGLLVGGALTDLLGWHWIFFINVPLGIVALVVARRLIRPEPGIGLAAGADLLGALLVTGAPALAVYGIVNAGNTSWGSATTLISLGGAVALALMFFVVESRVATPLIPPRILRNRALASAATVRFLFPVGGFGLNFTGALYLQNVLGYGPLKTGVAFIPLTATTGIVSLVVTPRLAGRFGLKACTLAGLVLATCGLLAVTRISDHSSYATTVLPTLLLNGFGFGLVIMPTLSMVMSAVAPADSGVASGVANVSVQIGTALGVAAMATVAASRTASLLAQGEHTGAALSGGYQLAFAVGAGCTALSFLVALVFLNPRRTGTATRTEPEVSGRALNDDGRITPTPTRPRSRGPRLSAPARFLSPRSDRI